MQKRLEYNKKDSAIIFLMALLVPTIITFLVSMICGMLMPDFVFVEKLVDGEVQRVYSTAFYYIILAINQLSFLGVFLVYSKMTNTEIKTAGKFKWTLKPLQIVIIIAIGLVAMYGFSYLVSYFEYLMELGGYQSTAFDYIDLSNFGMFLATVFVAAVLPSVCEESVFRGICLGGLKKMGATLAIVLSGLMFCIMHLSLEQCLYQFVLGMALSSIVMITGSIFASIILHFFNNFWILFSTYAFGGSGSGEKFVPKNVFDHIWPFLIAILTVAIIYFLLVLLKKCTKNSECEIFEFRSKKKANANINNNATIEENTEKNNIKEENIEQLNISEKIENNENQPIDENQLADDNQALTQDCDAGSNPRLIVDDKNQREQNFEHNVWLVASFVIGIAMWIISVVSSFLLK